VDTPVDRVEANFKMSRNQNDVATLVDALRR
jgi:hypothetical protein